MVNILEFVCPEGCNSVRSKINVFNSLFLGFFLEQSIFFFPYGFLFDCFSVDLVKSWCSTHYFFYDLNFFFSPFHFISFVSFFLYAAFCSCLFATFSCLVLSITRQFPLTAFMIIGLLFSYSSLIVFFFFVYPSDHWLLSPKLPRSGLIKLDCFFETFRDVLGSCIPSCRRSAPWTVSTQCGYSWMHQWIIYYLQNQCAFLHP